MLKKILCLPIFLCLLSFSIKAQSDLSDEIKKLIDNWSSFHEKGEYDIAIEQTHQAFNLAEKINDRELMAIALNKEGHSLISIPRRQSRNRKLAEDKFKRSLNLLANIDNPFMKIDNLQSLRWIAGKNKDQEAMVNYQDQIAAIENRLAVSARNEELVKDKEVLKSRLDKLNVQRQILNERVDSLKEDQLAAELLIALQKNQMDALQYESTRDSLLLHQKELELKEQFVQLELQQSQLQLQASQRNFFLALASIVGLLAIGAFFRYIETRKHNTILSTKNEIIEEEKKKSEQLLLNILPSMVANELKVNGVSKARRYDNATVLFSDFKNFSVIAESLSPEQLVSELDFYFKTFDAIIDKYNLEKIKTIGDAYMCVGGLPEERPGHPSDVVKAALEIQSYLYALKMEREISGQPFFEARIGIHSGPLVAGVVGSKKFAFDIWGDTVNVAARMESKSKAGKVNISATTFAQVKDNFVCTSRGKIPIKNRGEIEMYFVESLN